MSECECPPLQPLRARESPGLKVHLVLDSLASSCRVPQNHMADLRESGSVADVGVVLAALGCTTNPESVASSWIAAGELVEARAEKTAVAAVRH